MTEQRAPYTVDTDSVPSAGSGTESTHTLTLTRDEVSYLWLLTAFGADRLFRLEDGGVRDRHYALRHSVREKIFELENRRSAAWKR